MGNNKVTVVVASLTILGALSFLYFSQHGLPPRVDPRPHQALGQTVAEEALKLLRPGGRIILITRDTVTFRNPAVDAQMKSFHRTLHKAGTSVAVTNLVKLDPLRLVSVPPGDFFQILKKASEADVVVSFLGPPALSPEQLAKLEEKKPKVIAVCTGSVPSQVDLKRIFEDKLLQAAVISRKIVTAGAPATDNPQGWFDHLYALVTPATVSDLSLATARP